jgi:hypothetical protein
MQSVDSDLVVKLLLYLANTTPRISQELSSFGAALNFNWRDSCRNSRGEQNLFGGFLAELLVFSLTKLLFEFIR